MGIKGIEFVNIKQPDDLSIPRASGRPADDVGQSITPAVAYLQRQNPPGGVIYFPPGDYTVFPPMFPATPPGVYGGTVAIPSTITLEFAPGAVLKPGTRGGQTAIIEIEGGITAGLYKIFDAPPTHDSPGHILLTGDRIAEVYPEWWGAYGNPGIDSTSAIQASIDAAYRDRLLYRANGIDYDLLRPIPVVLTGRYLLTRTVTVLGSADGFQLRGAQGPGGANQGTPTLLGGLSAPGSMGSAPEFPWAMLYVAGGTAWTIEHVHFMAQLSTFTCLWIEVPNGPSPRFGSSSQACALRGCGFSRDASSMALRELVRVGGGRASPANTVGPANPGDVDRPRNIGAGDDVSSLLFDGCYFDMGGDVTRTTSDSVALNASNAFGIQFQACFFGGSARNFVWCTAGTFSIVSTTFHNVNPAGYDVFLERPGTPRNASPPGAFTATQCESQSWRFLGTYAPTAGDYPSSASWNTVLVGIRHANVNVTDGDHSADPPSILWDAAGVGSALVLVGCSLYGDVEIGPNASAVVDVGTVFITNRGTVGGAMVRGGRFTGNVAVLRGITGLIGDPNVGQNWALNAPGLRAGANLQLMLPAMPQESSDPALLSYPWSTGDVVVNRAVPVSDLGPGLPTLLDAALHNVFRFRKTYDPGAFNQFQPRPTSIVSARWERVFGSEDYSGPYIDDYFNGTLTLDAMIVPALYAIYEVLWDVCPVTTLDGDPILRAVGRDTVVLSTMSELPFPPFNRSQVKATLALTASSVEGRTVWPGLPGELSPSVGESTVVTSSMCFVTYVPGIFPGSGRREMDAAPVDLLADVRLCFRLAGLLQPPWNSDRSQRYYDVRIRRLK